MPENNKVTVRPDKSEMSMNDLDPRADEYARSHRDRRKADDPSYKGPERRLGKRREKELNEILNLLTKEAAKESD